MINPVTRYAHWRALCLALAVVLPGCGGGKSQESLLPSASSDGTFTASGLSFNAVPCASEGGTCTLSGTQNVAYGANGTYIVKQLSNIAHCDNATFGDALSGVAKRCFLAAAVVVAAMPPASGVSPAAPDPMAPPASAPATVPAPSPISPAVDPTAKLTTEQASRFLAQATFGPNIAEINRTSSMGYGAWLDEQFAAAPIDTHWAYIHRRGPIGCDPCTSGYVNAVMESFWTQAVRGPDQLHQRVVFALSEIFVISTVNSSIETVPAAHAGYLDMLSRNAFGNFRTLIEQVATHPAMGIYLSHMHNQKEDPAIGRLPDENFARELMQLFTIGLWELNEDGTRKKDASGNDVPTYGQAEIMGMAKVFTGWGWGNGDWDNGFSKVSNPNEPYERAYNLPMALSPAAHSMSEKKILGGVVIPANTSGTQSLKIALDTIFNHPNVGPFFGSQLIKRFVTSNPSPAYVKRVTLAFNDNGSGVRGDMKAVMRAVLLDPEARDAAKLVDPEWGKIREPMIRYANFMRAFDVKSTSGLYQIWNLEDTLSSIGQNPLRAPSVFNWFRPDYAPSGTMTAKGLVAPEFQITHETTTTGYANFMSGVTERQNTWYRDNIAAPWGSTTNYLAGDYSAEMALSGNPGALVDRLNLLLMAGQMSASTRKTIVDAVTATPADAGAGQRRVAFAVYLTMLSPEYIVQK